MALTATQKKVQKLEKTIEKSYAELERIRNKCKHPAKYVSKEHGCNTGNYCEQDDRYWTDCYCALCDKRWTVDGSI